MSVYFSEVIYNVENSVIEEKSSILNCTVNELTAIKLIDKQLNLYILIYQLKQKQDYTCNFIKPTAFQKIYTNCTFFFMF